jgi:hypothetical protein
MGRSGFTAVVALATVAMLPAAPAVAARQDPPEIVSIEVRTPRVDVTQGWGAATVAVHVRYGAGLPDTMRPKDVDSPNMITAYRSRGFPEAGSIAWPSLERVSGTATDGVWQSTVRLSPAWSGSYPVTQVQLTDQDGQTFYPPVANGPTITVSGSEVWSVVSVRIPVKIVTGLERWRPQARVTNTVTGRPVGGARVRAGNIFDSWPSLSWFGTAPGVAADAAGLWTSPITYDVQSRIEGLYYAYGGRGSRGWSMQGIGCDAMTVKMQASATYADTTLTDGQPLVVTGHVWPAPAIFLIDTPVNLQRNLGAAGWQTLTTSNARYSGRYTLTWYPPRPGNYQLRVSVPGSGGAPCTTATVGTTLATTAATVRWSRP